MNRASLFLVVSASILFSFGLLMIFNTTSAEVIDRALAVSTHAALFKQILYAGVGISLGLIVYLLGYERLIRYSPFLLLGATCLLVLVLIPKVGVTINGAKRWLFLFGFSFQPSECVKILLPAVFIRWVAREKNKIHFSPFIKKMLLFSLPLFLILIEPDNGTAVILVLLLVSLFFLAKIPFVYWLVPLFVLGTGGAIAAYNMPHVPDRIRIYLNPELDLKGKGHQPHQAKIAAGSGKLYGRGLGESLQKRNYLPEARSDYIAAIYAEETGFIGVLLLIGLYMTFSYAGFMISFRARDKEGFLLGAVLTFLTSIQAFINLGIVSGLLPSKGMTLPFFSQGGTSLMVNLVILFLLLDISRKTKWEVEYEK